MIEILAEEMKSDNISSLRLEGIYMLVMFGMLSDKFISDTSLV